MKGWSVVCSISCHCHSFSLLDKSVDEHELVIWLGAGEHLEFAFNLSKLSHVTDSAFDTNLVIFASLFLLNTAVDGIPKLFTCHAHESIFIVCQV